MEREFILTVIIHFTHSQNNTNITITNTLKSSNTFADVLLTLSSFIVAFVPIFQNINPFLSILSFNPVPDIDLLTLSSESLLALQ